jgi:hypothetical protein
MSGAGIKARREHRYNGRTLPYRLHVRAASRVYSLGLSSGSSFCHDGDGTNTVTIHWRGKRCYFLGWPRWKWRCLLKFHHWPGELVGCFDFCGKCVPWPCCGSTVRAHVQGCPDDWEAL